MRKKLPFSQLDVTRAIKGVERAGKEVSKVIIDPNGTINIILASQAAQSAKPNGWDKDLEPNEWDKRMVELGLLTKPPNEWDVVLSKPKRK